MIAAIHIIIAICTLAFPLSIAAADAAAKIRPINVAQPLRDPAITCDASSRTYYLTGTVGTERPDGAPDFDRNQGIFLWKSSDLATWHEVGWIWEFTKQRNQLGWPYQLEVVMPAATSFGHALQAAELHRLPDQWVICFSKNGMNAGLLTAPGPDKPFTLLEGGFWSEEPTAGKAPTFDSYKRNSPYSHMIAGDPSLFEDEDRSLYLVWGGGAVAKLKPDLSGWAEPPRHLQSAIVGWPSAEGASLVHPEGASLFKHGKTYYLTFAAWALEGGRASCDTWLCKAASLLGPYSPPIRFIPGGGQTKLFADVDGRLHAACMQNNKPAILEVTLP